MLAFFFHPLGLPILLKFYIFKQEKKRKLQRERDRREKGKREKKKKKQREGEEMREERERKGVLERKEGIFFVIHSWDPAMINCHTLAQELP